MRITTTLTTLVLAAGALTVSTGTSAYAIDTCFGLAPTIVTTPGEDTVTGTEGDDVIVDNHGRSIESLGGNDAICSVGTRWIDAGEGDDRVTVLDATKGNLTFLGLGSDVYVGSDADERVSTGTYDSTDMLGGVEGDVDTVSTFGGKDRVHSLAFGYPNADVVDLGAGDDSLRLRTSSGATFAMTGADGDDGMELELTGPQTDLSVDLGTGVVGFDAPSSATVTGFEDAAVGGRGQVTLRGTEGANDLGAGGKGARVYGLGGNDDIGVDTCGSVAYGGAGADRLAVGYYGCRSTPIALYGGSGPDSLRGGKFGDTLVGNSGRDTARGGKGRDRCQAEVKVACER